MKFSPSFLSAILLVLLTGPSGLTPSNVAAHGQVETPDELAFRAAYITQAKRSLNSCAAKIYTRDRLERRHHRRSELVQKLVERRGRDGVGIDLNPMLRKRDLSDKIDVKPLFPKNPECILTPESATGPFYVPSQLIRDDIRENVPGVELLVALEIIDIETCEPVPNVMVDFWQCSNLGVYSGYESEGSLGETFVRGLQPTDSDGIVTITSIFPGWYPTRTTHIHIAAHINGTISPNGDYYSGGTSPHIGQLFFDEDILDQIQKNYYYLNNTHKRTPNADDVFYRRFVSDSKSAEHTMSIVFVETGNINSGLVATMVIGIDSSRNYTLTGGALPSTTSAAGASSQHSGSQHSGQAIQVVIFGYRLALPNIF